jgi:hypothetical protein
LESNEQNRFRPYFENQDGQVDIRVHYTFLKSILLLTHGGAWLLHQHLQMLQLLPPPHIAHLNGRKLLPS